MTNVFTLINDSWNFCRKQPVLLQVGFWLLFLPMFAMNRLSFYLHSTQNTITNDNIGPVTLAIILILLLTVVVIWGGACVVIVGGRQLAASSGRSRTSFKAVRTETLPAIVPLLLTNILRGIFTILWGILFIVPGIIYALNTVFYPVIVVLEGIGYRAALKRSNALMKGKKASLYTTIILLSVLLFLPAYWLEALIKIIVPIGDASFFGDIISSALYTVSLILYSIAIIQLYGTLLPKKKPVTGGKTMKAVAKKTAKKKVAAKKK